MFKVAGSNAAVAACFVAAVLEEEEDAAGATKNSLGAGVTACFH